MLTFLLLAWAAAAPAETAAEVDSTASALRLALERYAAGEAVLRRKYPQILGPERRERLRAFYPQWAARIQDFPFSGLDAVSRIDWVLFHNQLGIELRSLKLADQAEAATAAFVPFLLAIRALESARAQIVLDRSKPSKESSAEVESLRAVPKRWFTFHNSYDSRFTGRAELRLPMSSWQWCMQDDESLRARMKGPLVMPADLGEEVTRATPTRPRSIPEHQSEPANPPATPDGLMFKPLYQMIAPRYATYWKHS